MFDFISIYTGISTAYSILVIVYDMPLAVKAFWNRNILPFLCDEDTHTHTHKHLSQPTTYRFHSDNLSKSPETKKTFHNLISTLLLFAFVVLLVVLMKILLLSFLNGKKIPKVVCSLHFTYVCVCAYVRAVTVMYFWFFVNNAAGKLINFPPPIPCSLCLA